MHELTLTRIFNAPPAQLFGAWSDPALWWFAPGAMTVAGASAELKYRGCPFLMMRSVPK